MVSPSSFPAALTLVAFPLSVPEDIKCEMVPETPFSFFSPAPMGRLLRITWDEKGISGFIVEIVKNKSWLSGSTSTSWC